MSMLLEEVLMLLEEVVVRDPILLEEVVVRDSRAAWTGRTDAHMCVPKRP